MGDSDDEFDRRRRDKFRRERNDYERREDRGRDRGGQWEERGRMGGWERRDRRDNYERRRERYSPNGGGQDISPPMKRFRGEWEDRGANYNHYGDAGGAAGGMHGHHANWSAGNQGEMGPPQQNYGNQQRGQEPDYPTQPPMMSFKQFLSSQDDNITDEEAIKKYNEYKLDFKKQQISEFFLAHKEEEWFKAKYNPEEFEQKQEEARQALKQRCNVFIKLFELGKTDQTPVDMEGADDIVKLLDAAVILMEGGTEFDLKILDMEQKKQKEEAAAHAALRLEAEQQKPTLEDGVDTDSKKDDHEEKEDGEDKEDGEEDDEPEERKSQQLDPISPEPEKPKKETQDFSQKNDQKKKRRDYNYESGSDSESGSLSDSEPETTTPPVEFSKGAAVSLSGDEPIPPGTDGGAPTGDSTSPKISKKEAQKSKDEDKEMDEAQEEEGEHRDAPKPQAFHTTHSIFLRNLAPTITKQEVEAMCKRYPGFLRVALQDPQPERRFFRRGWVTFDRTVNIKDICWNLNNIRLRDCEMGAIVNRELKLRVRPVNGITAHKTICKQDIKNAAKIVQNFDNKSKIWMAEGDEEKKDDGKEPQITMGLQSRNPVLKNITDYLVDEGSYEEEAYFGECVDDKQKDGNPEVAVERDDELCKVLDRMVLYLRIVHSFDYYSGVEYPNEDEMPHRCGIMHGRGSPPPNRMSQHDLNEWNVQFESRIAHYLHYRWQLDGEESMRLGKKDVEAELEKFVTANTQELAKDKWLCPISGKKFKGPEFVRKHIFNKHAEKVDEVKQEVAYFNNYLMDPKRPHLPEHPSSRQGVPQAVPYRQDSGPNSYGRQGGYQGNYRGNMGGGGGGGGGGYQRPPMYNNNYQGQRGGRGQRRGYHHSPNYHGRGGGHNDYRQDFRRDRGNFYRRDRGRQDPRGIIEYRDLDAPEDSDMF